MIKYFFFKIRFYVKIKAEVIEIKYNILSRTFTSSFFKLHQMFRNEHELWRSFSFILDK